MMSSVIPSLKKTLSASLLMFANGSTAIDGASRRAVSSTSPRSARTTVAPLERRAAGSRSSSRSTVRLTLSGIAGRDAITGGGT